MQIVAEELTAPRRARIAAAESQQPEPFTQSM
jgi:hypothetical protein